MKGLRWVMKLNFYRLNYLKCKENEDSPQFIKVSVKKITNVPVGNGDKYDYKSQWYRDKYNGNIKINSEIISIFLETADDGEGIYVALEQEINSTSAYLEIIR